MKLVFSSDHAGYNLKRHLFDYLTASGHECYDVGADTADQASSYVPFAVRAAHEVTKGNADLGIIVCGTGIGISITANKVKGARAALCTNEYMARMAREHNGANLLALGDRVLGKRLAESICDAFLSGEFEEGGRHQERVNEISGLESKAPKDR